MNPAEAYIKATKLRAKAYAYFYDEMTREFGSQSADKIFTAATYRLGIDGSGMYSQEAKHSARKLGEEFTSDPLLREVFQQELLAANDETVTIKMKQCPLVDQWKEMNVPQLEIEKLCQLANRIDYGIFESLGYELASPQQISRGGESCILVVTRKKSE